MVYNVTCAMWVMYSCRIHTWTFTYSCKRTQTTILRHCQTLQHAPNNASGSAKKRFQVLKKCKNKFDCLLCTNAFYNSFKAKSQRTIRLHSYKSIFIIFAPSYVNYSHQNRFKCCNLHNLIFIVP